MYYLNILYCNVLSEDSCPASGLWHLALDSDDRDTETVSSPLYCRSTVKDPHAIPAPNRCQRALSTPLQPNHTINTINSKYCHLLRKVTKIHKRQVYNPKNE